MSYRPTLVAKLLASWQTYLLIFSWLPLARSIFDGVSYRWGTSHFGYSFSGAGIGPDLWLPAAKMLVFVYLIYGLLRGGGPLLRVLLVLWSLAWPLDAILAYRRDPEAMMFHGDTLGIHLNLGLVIPVVTGFFALLAIVWALGAGGRSLRRPPWTARNRFLLTLWVILLPIQFVLLRFGEPHGTTDVVGVVLTIAQCPLLFAALYPWRTRVGV